MKLFIPKMEIKYLIIMKIFLKIKKKKNLNLKIEIT